MNDKEKITPWELAKFWWYEVGSLRIAMMLAGSFLVGNQLGFQAGAGALLLAIAVAGFS